MQLGLVYGKKLDKTPPRDLPLYNFLSYVDNNFTNDSEDQKSVIGHFFFFNITIVLWSSKKQRIVSTFIIKAKYIVFAYVAKEIV